MGEEHVLLQLKATHAKYVQMFGDNRNNKTSTAKTINHRAGNNLTYRGCYVGAIGVLVAIENRGAYNCMRIRGFLNKRFGGG